MVKVDSQQSVFEKLGELYLYYLYYRYYYYRAQTNTRGVNLSAKAEALLNTHPDSIAIAIQWKRSSAVMNPIEQWGNYWRS